MTKDEMAKLLSETFVRLQGVREAGQKEYAHDTSNAFSNFERTGKELDIPREKVLWIFMKKHFDGILAHINGHRSQREPVYGRIDDAHVYLELLRGMIIEDELSVVTPENKFDADEELINVVSLINAKNFAAGILSSEELKSVSFAVPITYTKNKT